MSIGGRGFVSTISLVLVGRTIPSRVGSGLGGGSHSVHLAGLSVRVRVGSCFVATVDWGLVGGLSHVVVGVLVLGSSDIVVILVVGGGLHVIAWLLVGRSVDIEVRPMVRRLSDIVSWLGVSTLLDIV